MVFLSKLQHFGHMFKPVKNWSNQSGSRFIWLNRRFLVFFCFFRIFGFFREPDRFRSRFTIKPVGPTGPVRFLKPCALHKFLKSHNFTPHYFNIYFLIEFQFYSIIKPSIRILTHHIFFNIRIYYPIYKTQS
jgi:hypothetical protein